METHHHLTQIGGHIFSILGTPSPAKYDFRAKYYEWLVSTTWFNRIYWNSHPKFYTEFAREAIVKEKGKLIDVGCGGLAHTAALYSLTKNNCTLFDRSVGMLEVAEERLLNLEGDFPENIQLLQGDVFCFPFLKTQFDVLCSFGTLHLFDDKLNFLDCLLSILRPGGHFYLSTMTKDHWNSHLFMRFMRVFGEFGALCSSENIVELFSNLNVEIDYYKKGSVLFIKGKKLQDGNM